MAQRALQSLGVPEPVLRKVRALGIETPAGLRSMLTAARDDLKRYLGADAFAAVEEALQFVADDTPDSGFQQGGIVHGARLEMPPAPNPPAVDLALRDRLFAELQEVLKRDDAKSRARVRELEARLDAILER